MYMKTAARRAALIRGVYGTHLCFKLSGQAE